jgi:hypothetical protein
MYDVIRPDGRVFGRNPGQPDEGPYSYATAVDIAANVNGTVVPAYKFSRKETGDEPD